MRVLPGALGEEARRACGTVEVSAGALLKETSRARALPVLSVILGALLGVAYVRLMLNLPPTWPAYVLGGVGGACAVYLLLVVPRLTWIVLRRQWIRLALRATGVKSEQLLGRAESILTPAAAEPGPDQMQARCDLAVVRYLRNDLEQAEAMLRKLYEEHPSPAWVSNLLVVLATKGEWPDVAWLIDQELDDPRGLPDANLALVAASAPYGRLVERLWVVAQDGSLPRTLNNIGVRMLQMGDYMRAEDAFSLIKERHASYAPAHANAGVLALRREQYGQAISEMGSAAALEPGEGLLLSNLGAALCQAGNLPLAQRWLREALKVAPGNPHALVNLGNVYALGGSYQEALETFSEAARANTLAAAHHNAALMLAARDHTEAALEQQKLARDVAPNDPEVVQNLGCLLWIQGKHDEARDCFGSSATHDPTMKSNLIRTELAAGRPRRALDLLLQVSYAEEEMEFDRGLAHLLTAVQALREGGRREVVRERDLVEAIACFHKVVATGGARAREALINLGIAQYLSEEYEDAAEAFTAALERTPGHEELGYAIAMCYVTAAAWVQQTEGDTRGETPPRVRELLIKARPYLEQAVHVKSVGDNARFNLGVLYYLLGEYRKAAAVLRPIARPDSPWQVLNVLGIAQARLARELQRSIQSAVLLRMARKRQMEIEILSLLSGAIHAFTQVLRQQPANAIAHANIGLAQYLRNRGDDVEQALQHWRRMRDIGGEWGQRIFEIFSDAVGARQEGLLSFQDIEVSFQPLPLEEWVTFVPPRMAGLKYAVQEVMDPSLPELIAQNDLVRRALRARARAEHLRRVLRRLRA